MARSLISLRTINANVGVIPGASVLMLDEDGSAFSQTIYAEATGGATLANPLTSDTYGLIEAWVDAPQRAVARVTARSETTELILDLEPDPSSIVGLAISGGTITGAAITATNAALTTPTITGGTISGGTISGGTVSGAAITATNAVLTTADINTPDIDGGTIDDAAITGGTLTGTTLVGVIVTLEDSSPIVTALTITGAGATALNITTGGATVAGTVTAATVSGVNATLSGGLTAATVTATNAALSGTLTVAAITGVNATLSGTLTTATLAATTITGVNATLSGGLTAATVSAANAALSGTLTAGSLSLPNGSIPAAMLAANATSQVAFEDSDAAFTATGDNVWAFDSASLPVTITLPVAGKIVARACGSFQSDTATTGGYFGIIRVGAHSTPPWVAFQSFMELGEAQSVTVQWAESLAAGTYTFHLGMACNAAGHTLSAAGGVFRSLVVEALYR